MHAWWNPIAIWAGLALCTATASAANVALNTMAVSPHFEENRGQTDAAVRFLSRGRRGTLFLTADGATFELRGPEQRRSVIRMRLLGAASETRVEGTDRLPGRSSYFIGNDPSK